MLLGKHCTVKPATILRLPTNISQAWLWLVIPSLNSDQSLDYRRADLPVSCLCPARTRAQLCSPTDSTVAKFPRTWATRYPLRLVV